MKEAVKLYVAQVEDGEGGMSADVFFTWDDAVTFVEDDIKGSITDTGEWDEVEEECTLDEYAGECAEALTYDVYEEPRTGRAYAISVIPVKVSDVLKAAGAAD